MHGILLVLVPLAMLGQDLHVTLTTENGTINIKNEHTAPLTACVLGTDNSATSGMIEGLITKRDKALYPSPEEDTPPGQVWKIDDAAGMSVQAVVFADGTVAGNRSWIEWLLNTRRRAYQDIPRAIDMLTGEPASIEEFRAWRESSFQLPSRIKWEEMFAAGQDPLALLMPPDPVVPLQVVEMLKQGEATGDIVLFLRNWRDRLAQSKPSIIPTTSPQPPGEPSPHQD